MATKKTAKQSEEDTDYQQELQLRVRKLEDSVDGIVDNLNMLVSILNQVPCTCVPPTCRKDKARRRKPKRNVD